MWGGTKISAAGNYSIGLNTPIYYREKVYNLEVGVRTQIDTNAAGVYVTLNGGGILNVEDGASLLTAFPIIAISKIVPLDDVFIPEHIVREENIKTINGQSILGSGDIEISSSLTESDIAAMGFTKNTGTYSKPSGGIPKSDLASAVQTSLDKADSAVIATIWGDYRFAENTDGMVSRGKVVYALPDSVNDYTSEDDVIVTTNTLKTINGESLFGEGDITISGGSGSGAYQQINHGSNSGYFTLIPNTFHVWDEVGYLELSLAPETSGVANEYLFQFTSGSTATSLTLPDDIKWANDSAPTIAENMIYQVSILKGLASVLEFDNAPEIVLIQFSVNGATYSAEEGMTWETWVNSSYTNGTSRISGNIVYWQSLNAISGVLPKDTIIANRTYTTYLAD